MTDATVVFILLGVVVGLFVWNRLPVEIVAVGAALTLAALGIITFEQSLAGFGDSTVVFIASLFVVSEAIDSAGVTTWAGQQMVARARGSRTRLVVLMMLVVAALTAIITVNGAVAALIPMVVVVALRQGIAPSKMLIPLAFGAHAGSQLVLTGTPIHILVSDAARDAGEAGFGFFDFSLVGVPLVAGSVLLVVWLGPKLLPDRRSSSIPPDLSDHARTLIEQYSLSDWVDRFTVRPDSDLIGATLDDLSVTLGEDVRIVGAQRGQGILDRTEPLEAGDLVTLRGEDEDLDAFAVEHGLTRKPSATGGTLINASVGVVEAVVPPRSELIGTPVFPGMYSSSGDFVLLGVHRQGTDLDHDVITLEAGDTMLLQGTWGALDRTESSERSVIVVDSPGQLRRQAIPMGRHSVRALVVLGVMIALLATNAVPPAVATLAAAGAMILTGVVGINQAYRSVSWTTVVLVAGMIPISTAVVQTGAADRIAGLLLDVVGNAGPRALLLGLFVITAVLGQLISNMATAMVVIPIAVTAAVDMGVSVRPVMMSITVAAAAAFLTPVATPGNLMVMGPGGYEFKDYWKMGLPMLILFGVASVLLVPVFWSF